MSTVIPQQQSYSGSLSEEVRTVTILEFTISAEDRLISVDGSGAVPPVLAKSIAEELVGVAIKVLVGFFTGDGGSAEGCVRTETTVTTSTDNTIPGKTTTTMKTTMSKSKSNKPCKEAA